MKNRFIMLAGLPGGGKSFLARKLLEDASRQNQEAVWLSSDRIREELYGAEEIQGNSNEVFEKMRERTVAALKEGKTVIYDACNINSKKRKAFLNSIKHFNCEKVCVICAVPYEECLRRNSRRDRVVPEEVIERMYLTWNTPYYFEGWDKIELFYSEGSKGSYGTMEAYVEKQMEYEQHNPHHSETLGEHLKGVYDYLIEKGYCSADSNLAAAALIHDCGKPFTKVFTDSKGNPTEIAHYYQHAPAGAYDAMFFDFGDKKEEDILEIAVLINLHMHPFTWKKDGAFTKQEERYGTELYRKIMMLNEADEAASIRVTE